MCHAARAPYASVLEWTADRPAAYCGSMMRIAIVTCVNLPEPDPDQPALLAALRAARFDAEVVAWDDPVRSMTGFDACLIRSTWNYYREIDAFSRWIDAAAARTRLFNPAAVFHWNKHKGYLRELERHGAAIVPTEFVAGGPRRESGAAGSARARQASGAAGYESGRPAAAAPAGGSPAAGEPGSELKRLAERRGWSEIVIKPAISAGSFRTHRFARDRWPEAQQTLDELTAERDAMIQPFLEGVGTRGERSLVWIDGEFTHAIHKHPRFIGQEERVALAEFDTPLREAGARVMAAVGRVCAFSPRDLLYARIDLMPGSSGEWLLSELEVIEPSLFLLEHPPALEHLVAALARRLRDSA